MLQVEEKAEPLAGIRKVTFERVDRLPGGRLVARFDLPDETVIAVRAVQLTEDVAEQLTRELRDLLRGTEHAGCWDCRIGIPQHPGHAH